MTFGVNEDILWLHITICYAEMIMEIFEYQDNLSCVEAGSGLVEALGPTQVREDLSTRAVVQLETVSCVTLRVSEKCGAQAYIGILYRRSW